MEIFTLLKNLIDIDSTTGSEARIVDFVYNYLHNEGFEIDTQEVSYKRYNLFAKHGEPQIVFATHMDTVPPYIPYSEGSDYVYGRGACDAKGILAAQINTVCNLIAQKKSDIGLLFLVGEEAGNDGAKKANDIMNQCRFLINGEPTDNKLANGHKGELRFTIKTNGISAHSAYPEKGESAISKLIDIIYKLDHLTWPSDPKLSDSTLNIGILSGGVEANVVPDAALAEAVLRVTTNVDDIKMLIEDIVSDNAEIYYGVEFDPVDLKVVDGFDTTVVSYGTDIPFLTNWGTPLLLGPGSILDAHSPDERILKKELVRAVSLYEKLYNNLSNNASHE